MIRVLLVLTLSYLLMNEPPKNTSAMHLDNSNENKPVQVATSKAEREPKQSQPVKAKKAKADKPKPKPSSCASEITKYDWNHTVAHNVMLVESGGSQTAVNNNPSTGDYSVGCFQVNLYGNLRNTRPSEEWLKIAANNVSYAYQLYRESGWAPWSATTCRYKVNCY